jgi:2-oxoglutarate-Fe(II)-dependent oxygenase superfamily protein
VTDPAGPCPSPPVRLTANETLIEADPKSDAAFAAQFAQRHVLELPGLLQPDVLEMLAPAIRAARFVPREVDGVGARLRERPTRLGNLLCLLLRSQALRDWLTRITGISPLAGVTGAVARFECGGGQSLGWHNDIDATGRMLAVTINIGDAPYEGGVFEMRRRDTGEILFRHNHRKPGSALVFCVSKKLQHRVTPVSAGGPRTVFSGWYLSGSLERRA